LEKKNIAIIVLAIALAASGVGNIVLGIGGIQPPEDKGPTLRVIRGSGPASFDGLDQWDVSSGQVINQVVENLFQYDYTNLSYPLKHRLAEKSKWMNTTTLRIWVRPNVWFHDGTKLDADAVKWNLERINYFCNATGTLPSNTTPAYPGSLYFFADGVTPIMNNISKVDEMTLDINLNGPYSPFRDLMTYTSGVIYSPASTPFYRYLDTVNEYPVGTGPYILTSYKVEAEARFKRYDRYWRTNPYFENVVYTYISNTVTANQAMLSLDHDYLGGGSPDFYDQFKANPDITFYNFTGDTGQTDTCYWYVGINNNEVPLEVRAALNYAYNYTFLLEEYSEGHTLKAKSPLPPGFPYHNEDIVPPNFNITKARMWLQTSKIDGPYAPVGWDPTFGGASESNWTSWGFDGSWGTTPINSTLAYWTYPGSSFYAETFAALQQSFGYIGITLEKRETYWSPFLDLMRNSPGAIDLWSLGWCPDFLNPLNMLAPLFLNTSDANYIQYSNETLMNLIKDAQVETDPNVLKDLFHEIQRTIVTRDFAHIPLEVDPIFYVHAKNLKGVAYNALTRLYLYSMYK
jgi:ABC-type transport system substrate-binding protein